VYKVLILCIKVSTLVACSRKQ